MTAGLASAMAKGGVRLQPMAEAHRAALKAACAEDPEIWPIYATSWDPAHFDQTFDRTMALENARKHHNTYPRVYVVQTGKKASDWKVAIIGEAHPGDLGV